MSIKTELKSLKSGASALEKKVINVILDQDEIESFMKDVVQHGCISGIVSELIYYSDTVAFFKKYKKDILDMLESEGLHPSELNGWDNSDPLAQDEVNMNVLAWFGFENVTYNLASQLEII